MKNLIFTVLSVGVFLILTEGVKVSLYYEALCYDSSRFLAYQLYPGYASLKNYIQLELIPFGKATHNFYNNKWIFDCQHGPTECKGNKYQSCALAQNSGQDKDLAFVHCVMRETNPADVAIMEFCAKRINLNWEKISKCARSHQGDDLLAHNGNKTNNLEPNISFVPTIVYNDEFDDYLQERSLVDFAAVVCSKIKGEKPTACRGKRLPERRNFQDYFSD
ncbi:GILT-like protein 1 [Zophobas morio]|uniref:GILT-like protein 1 n=1 Tax=Zophobas morio TaxID=2755281 RepID=UPI0030827736